MCRLGGSTQYPLSPEGLLEFIETKAAEADGASPGAGDAPPLTRPAHPYDDVLAGRTPPPIETMRAILRHLADKDYFEYRTGVLKDDEGRISRVGWIETGMALRAAYGDEVATRRVSICGRSRTWMSARRMMRLLNGSPLPRRPSSVM